jgi:hypothetical protein
VPAAGALALPSATSAVCLVDYYQNGPYGSAAWKAGWGVCVTVRGTYDVPTARNDQASAWDSCASGAFWANQPHNPPAADFPANSAGNFPWRASNGTVPNDSLSVIGVGAGC